MSEGFTDVMVRLLDRYFPERQIILRSRGEVGFVTFGQKSQVALSLAGILFLGWLAYSSLGIYLQLDIIASKDAHIARMVGAHERLNADLRAVEHRYRKITANLENNQRVLGDVLRQRANLDRMRTELLRELSLTRKQRDLALNRGKQLQSRLGRLESSLRRTLDESNDLQLNLSQVTNQLSPTESDRDWEQRQRMALAQNLNTMQQSLSGLKQVRQNLQVDLESSEDMVARLTDQRDRAFSTNQALNKRIGDLESRLEQLQLAQQTLVENIHERTDANILELETVVQLTGLNLNRLLDRINHKQVGTGGPLLSSEEERAFAGEWVLRESSPMLSSLGLLENRLSRWSALNAVLERLPITPPVDSFSISSGYGKRRDPFTKRRAFHGGIDLAGVRRSRVYATSPGVVTYVGWKGPYGRLVEIDHGLGLRTRYGHLQKILVKKGQKVEFRQKIGLMGNSGRSTGTHVHYEVVFDGKPLNPKKFLKAGKYVFKG
ncbi:MAG: peptidoglycan DD-metalloendopeptidase family protein [Alphaproteobacteria bacterium]|nr:peptidoglycan DD-metalloendopeptidase family protein [Alphaproteobacteria bacterium]MDP6830358.1 peptidoglycan DD-metalloendopeptidase family protein [Alphaproteobacteria bacterium]